MTDENQTVYVAYLMAPARTPGAMLFSQQVLALQEKRVKDFISQKPNGKLLKSFIESCEHPRHRWPVLEDAVTFCLENQATLIIAEIRNFTSNDAYAKQILRLLGIQRPRSDASHSGYQGDIYCCDQPFITKESFSALAEHAKQQKKLHGELIKAGLSRTTAKSGNPHASDVISKVNKPKIDNAIVYALMLQPIISEYTAKGF
ncbi:MAG TPA: hypothetical protein PLD88_05370, partial [Candidatus Berkiella sp.]|nr:hypothetical protein [Candidatus Berkiella sp.]